MAASLVVLSVEFTPPANPTPTHLGIPLLSLTPQIDSEAGTIQGGETHYYAISAVDEREAESALSFSVRRRYPSRRIRTRSRCGA